MTITQEMAMPDHADRQQEHDMRNLLAEMESKVSYGASTAYDKSGGPGEGSGDGRPQGDSRPMHEEWRDNYNRASDFTARDRVLERARQALADELTSRADRTKDETPEQRTVRIQALLGEGWSEKDIINTGRFARQEVEQATRNTVVPKIIRLHRDGHTQRQIEAIAGVSQATVCRILKEAAA